MRRINVVMKSRDATSDDMIELGPLIGLPNACGLKDDNDLVYASDVS